MQTAAGPGGQALVVGFVLTGTGNKPLLIRGIGPGLVPFGVGGTMTDPNLTVLGPNPPSATQVAASNDNWSSSIATAMAAAGAFPLTTGSLDAALIASLAPGNYTAQVSGTTAGQVLAEIYDTTIGTGPTLINLSTKASVAAGGGLTAGFTISGNVAKTVLIRGIGPSLGTLFGIGGALANPQLTLYDSHSNAMQTNAGWGATSALIAAFAQTGAFSLGTSPTADSAILVTLAPGGYTAQVTGLNGTSGVALIEIYQVQ